VYTTGYVPSSRTFHRAVVVASRMYLLGGYDGTDRLHDLYSIHVGPLSPPSLLSLCATYTRHNVDRILAHTSFRGVPYGAHTHLYIDTYLRRFLTVDDCILMWLTIDVLGDVIFRRDAESNLRGKCTLCRDGRCCMYKLSRVMNDTYIHDYNVIEVCVWFKYDVLSAGGDCVCDNRICSHKCATKSMRVMV
jgi:hypothetical protein